VTYIRIRWKKQGGHYHCRLFTTQNYHGTFAKCGELVFDEREWPDIVDALEKRPTIELIEDAHESFSKESIRILRTDI
jgi:hypothetical protein